MKANNEEFITLCASNGIEGIDIVNELMRFNVLDQLISSNASSREWVSHLRSYMHWQKNLPLNPLAQYHTI